MMKKRDKQVLKASGLHEGFDLEKLERSIRRCGVPPDMATTIARMVMSEVNSDTSTKKIFRLAKRHLNRMHHPSSLRYSLKKALLRLGPTGYPFEKYIGKLLSNYGFKTRVNVILKGRCVSHEVDVIAENQRNFRVIECKYHNTSGRATDVKVAMYVYSRVKDLESELRPRHPGKKYEGWLITNTRCTQDAVKFADCTGLKIMGWGHPKGNSLENLIEQKKLYPVTILSGIKRGLSNRLIENNIILLKDILKLDVAQIQTLLSLDSKRARTIKKQAEEICGP